MRLLLDTHAFLWYIADDDRLGAVAGDLIDDTGNECLLSVASIWEMAIKVSTGKLDLPSPLAGFLGDQLAKTGIGLLPIGFAHAVAVSSLPCGWHNGREHRDPFDRLIVSQALAEEIPIVSVDEVLGDYGVTRYW